MTSSSPSSSFRSQLLAITFKMDENKLLAPFSVSWTKSVQELSSLIETEGQKVLKHNGSFSSSSDEDDNIVEDGENNNYNNYNAKTPSFSIALNGSDLVAKTLKDNIAAITSFIVETYITNLSTNSNNNNNRNNNNSVDLPVHTFESTTNLLKSARMIVECFFLDQDCQQDTKNCLYAAEALEQVVSYLCLACSAITHSPKYQQQQQQQQKEKEAVTTTTTTTSLTLFEILSVSEDMNHNNNGDVDNNENEEDDDESKKFILAVYETTSSCLELLSTLALTAPTYFAHRLIKWYEPLHQNSNTNTNTSNNQQQQLTQNNSGIPSQFQHLFSLGTISSNDCLLVVLKFPSKHKSFWQVQRWSAPDEKTSVAFEKIFELHRIGLRTVFSIVGSLRTNSLIDISLAQMTSAATTSPSLYTSVTVGSNYSSAFGVFTLLTENLYADPLSSFSSGDLSAALALLTASQTCQFMIALQDISPIAVRKFFGGVVQVVLSKDNVSSLGLTLQRGAEWIAMTKISISEESRTLLLNAVLTITRTLTSIQAEVNHNNNSNKNQQENKMNNNNGQQSSEEISASNNNLAITNSLSSRFDVIYTIMMSRYSPSQQASRRIPFCGSPNWLHPQTSKTFAVISKMVTEEIIGTHHHHNFVDPSSSSLLASNNSNDQQQQQQPIYKIIALVKRNILRALTVVRGITDIEPALFATALLFFHPYRKHEHPCATLESANFISSCQSVLRCIAGMNEHEEEIITSNKKRAGGVSPPNNTSMTSANSKENNSSFIMSERQGSISPSNLASTSAAAKFFEAAPPPPPSPPAPLFISSPSNVNASTSLALALVPWTLTASSLPSFPLSSPFFIDLEPPKIDSPEFNVISATLASLTSALKLHSDESVAVSSAVFFHFGTAIYMSVICGSPMASIVLNQVLKRLNSSDENLFLLYQLSPGNLATATTTTNSRSGGTAAASSTNVSPSSITFTPTTTTTTSSSPNIKNVPILHAVVASSVKLRDSKYPQVREAGRQTAEFLATGFRAWSVRDAVTPHLRANLVEMICEACLDVDKKNVMMRMNADVKENDDATTTSSSSFVYAKEERTLAAKTYFDALRALLAPPIEDQVPPSTSLSSSNSSSSSSHHQKTQQQQQLFIPLSSIQILVSCCFESVSTACSVCRRLIDDELMKSNNDNNNKEVQDSFPERQQLLFSRVQTLLAICRSSILKMKSMCKERGFTNFAELSKGNRLSCISMVCGLMHNLCLFSSSSSTSPEQQLLALPVVVNAMLLASALFSHRDRSSNHLNISILEPFFAGPLSYWMRCLFEENNNSYNDNNNNNNNTNNRRADSSSFATTEKKNEELTKIINRIKLTSIIRWACSVAAAEDSFDWLQQNISTKLPIEEDITSPSTTKNDLLFSTQHFDKKYNKVDETDDEKSTRLFFEQVDCVSSPLTELHSSIQGIFEGHAQEEREQGLNTSIIIDSNSSNNFTTKSSSSPLVTPLPLTLLFRYISNLSVEAQANLKKHNQDQADEKQKEEQQKQKSFEDLSSSSPNPTKPQQVSSDDQQQQQQTDFNSMSVTVASPRPAQLSESVGDTLRRGISPPQQTTTTPTSNSNNNSKERVNNSSNNNNNNSRQVSPDGQTNNSNEVVVSPPPVPTTTEKENLDDDEIVQITSSSSATTVKIITTTTSSPLAKKETILKIAQLYLILHARSLQASIRFFASSTTSSPTQSLSLLRDPGLQWFSAELIQQCQFLDSTSYEIFSEKNKSSNSKPRLATRRRSATTLAAPSTTTTTVPLISSQPTNIIIATADIILDCLLTIFCVAAPIHLPAHPLLQTLDLMFTTKGCVNNNNSSSSSSSTGRRFHEQRTRKVCAFFDRFLTSLALPFPRPRLSFSLTSYTVEYQKAKAVLPSLSTTATNPIESQVVMKSCGTGAHLRFSSSSVNKMNNKSGNNNNASLYHQNVFNQPVIQSSSSATAASSAQKQKMFATKERKGLTILFWLQVSSLTSSASVETCTTTSLMIPVLTFQLNNGQSCSLLCHHQKKQRKDEEPQMMLVVKFQRETRVVAVLPTSSSSDNNNNNNWMLVSLRVPFRSYLSTAGLDGVQFSVMSSVHFVRNHPTLLSSSASSSVSSSSSSYMIQDCDCHFNGRQDVLDFDEVSSVEFGGTTQISSDQQEKSFDAMSQICTQQSILTFGSLACFSEDLPSIIQSSFFCLGSDGLGALEYTDPFIMERAIRAQVHLCHGLQQFNILNNNNSASSSSSQSPSSLMNNYSVSPTSSMSPERRSKELAGLLTKIINIQLLTNPQHRNKFEASSSTTDNFTINKSSSAFTELLWSKSSGVDLMNDTKSSFASSAAPNFDFIGCIPIRSSSSSTSSSSSGNNHRLTKNSVTLLVSFSNAPTTNSHIQQLPSSSSFSVALNRGDGLPFLSVEHWSDPNVHQQYQQQQQQQQNNQQQQQQPQQQDLFILQQQQQYKSKNNNSNTSQSNNNITSNTTSEWYSSTAFGASTLFSSWTALGDAETFLSLAALAPSDVEKINFNNNNSNTTEKQEEDHNTNNKLPLEQKIQLDQNLIWDLQSCLVRVACAGLHCCPSWISSRAIELLMCSMQQGRIQPTLKIAKCLSDRVLLPFSSSSAGFLTQMMSVVLTPFVAPLLLSTPIWSAGTNSSTNNPNNISSSSKTTTPTSQKASSSTPNVAAALFANTHQNNNSTDENSSSAASPTTRRPRRGSVIRRDLEQEATREAQQEQEQALQHQQQLENQKDQVLRHIFENCLVPLLSPQNVFRDLHALMLHQNQALETLLHALVEGWIGHDSSLRKRGDLAPIICDFLFHLAELTPSGDASTALNYRKIWAAAVTIISNTEELLESEDSESSLIWLTNLFRSSISTFTTTFSDLRGLLHAEPEHTYLWCLQEVLSACSNASHACRLEVQRGDDHHDDDEEGETNNNNNNNNNSAPSSSSSYISIKRRKLFASFLESLQHMRMWSSFETFSIVKGLQNLVWKEVDTSSEHVDLYYHGRPNSTQLLLLFNNAANNNNDLEVTMMNSNNENSNQNDDDETATNNDESSSSHPTHHQLASSSSTYHHGSPLASTIMNQILKQKQQQEQSLSASLNASSTFLSSSETLLAASSSMVPSPTSLVSQLFTSTALPYETLLPSPNSGFISRLSVQQRREAQLLSVWLAMLVPIDRCHFLSSSSLSPSNNNNTSSNNNKDFFLFSEPSAIPIRKRQLALWRNNTKVTGGANSLIEDVSAFVDDSLSRIVHMMETLPTPPFGPTTNFNCFYSDFLQKKSRGANKENNNNDDDLLDDSIVLTSTADDEDTRHISHPFVFVMELFASIRKQASSSSSSSSSSSLITSISELLLAKTTRLLKLCSESNNSSGKPTPTLSMNFSLLACITLGWIIPELSTSTTEQQNTSSATKKRLFNKLLCTLLAELSSEDASLNFFSEILLLEVLTGTIKNDASSSSSKNNTNNSSPSVLETILRFNNNNSSSTNDEIALLRFLTRLLFKSFRASNTTQGDYQFAWEQVAESIISANTIFSSILNALGFNNKNNNNNDEENTTATTSIDDLFAFLVGKSESSFPFLFGNNDFSSRCSVLIDIIASNNTSNGNSSADNLIISPKQKESFSLNDSAIVNKSRDLCLRSVSQSLERFLERNGELVLASVASRRFSATPVWGAALCSLYSRRTLARHRWEIDPLLNSEFVRVRLRRLVFDAEVLPPPDLEASEDTLSPATSIQSMKDDVELLREHGVHGRHHVVEQKWRSAHFHLQNSLPLTMPSAQIHQDEAASTSSLRIFNATKVIGSFLGSLVVPHCPDNLIPARWLLLESNTGFGAKNKRNSNNNAKDKNSNSSRDQQQNNNINNNNSGNKNNNNNNHFLNKGNNIALYIVPLLSALECRNNNNNEDNTAVATENDDFSFDDDRDFWIDDEMMDEEEEEEQEEQEINDDEENAKSGGKKKKRKTPQLLSDTINSLDGTKTPTSPANNNQQQITVTPHHSRSGSKRFDGNIGVGGSPVSPTTRNSTNLRINTSYHQQQQHKRQQSGGGSSAPRHSRNHSYQNYNNSSTNPRSSIQQQQMMMTPNSGNNDQSTTRASFSLKSPFSSAQHNLPSQAQFEFVKGATTAGGKSYALQMRSRMAMPRQGTFLIGSDIRAVFSRIVVLEDAALEIYSTEQEPLTFLFASSDERRSAHKQLEEHLSGKNGCFLDPSLAFQSTHVGVPPFPKMTENLLKRWVKEFAEGKHSVLKFLMVMNLAAGRSYNDLRQYPVLPHILRDRDENLSIAHLISKQLVTHSHHDNLQLSFAFENYNNSNNNNNNDDSTSPADQQQEQQALSSFFRNFSRPMTQQQDGPIDFDTARSHVHYSSKFATAITLVRLMPFTQVWSDENDGKLVYQDRRFLHDLRSMFHKTKRELIPELFSLPDSLRNINKLTFDESVNAHALVPKWCSDSVHFVLSHREVLECPFVRSNIHQWVDLVFGCYQRGEAGENVGNFLPPASCIPIPENVDDMQREAFEMAQEAVLNKVGHTPAQLFNKTLRSISSSAFLTTYRNPMVREWNCERITSVKNVHGTKKIAVCNKKVGQPGVAATASSVGESIAAALNPLNYDLFSRDSANTERILALSDEMFVARADGKVIVRCSGGTVSAFVLVPSTNTQQQQSNKNINNNNMMNANSYSELTNNESIFAMNANNNNQDTTNTNDDASVSLSMTTTSESPSTVNHNNNNLNPSPPLPVSSPSTAAAPTNTNNTNNVSSSLVSSSNLTNFMYPTIRGGANNNNEVLTQIDVLSLYPLVTTCFCAWFDEMMVQSRSLLFAGTSSGVIVAMSSQYFETSDNDSNNQNKKNKTKNNHDDFDEDEDPMILRAAESSSGGGLNNNSTHHQNRVLSIRGRLYGHSGKVVQVVASSLTLVSASDDGDVLMFDAVRLLLLRRLCCGAFGVSHLELSDTLGLCAITMNQQQQTFSVWNNNNTQNSNNNNNNSAAGGSRIVICHVGISTLSYTAEWRTDEHVFSTRFDPTDRTIVLSHASGAEARCLFNAGDNNNSNNSNNNNNSNNSRLRTNQQRAWKISVPNGGVKCTEVSNANFSKNQHSQVLLLTNSGEVLHYASKK